MLNVITKLLISRFFYLKMLDLNEKTFHRYKRVKLRRFSSNKIIISKANVNHFNDRITITIFLFNKQKSLIKSKLEKLDLSFFFKIAKIIKKRSMWERKKITLIRRIKLLKKRRFINTVKHFYFFSTSALNWNIIFTYIQQRKNIVRKLYKEIKKHVFYLQNKYSVVNFNRTHMPLNLTPLWKLQSLLYAYTPYISYSTKTSSGKGVFLENNLNIKQNVHSKAKVLFSLFMSIYSVINSKAHQIKLDKAILFKTGNLAKATKNNFLTQKRHLKYIMPHIVLATLLEKKMNRLQNVMFNSTIIFKTMFNHFSLLSNITQSQFNIKKLKDSILFSIFANFNKVLVKKVLKKEMQHHQFNQSLYLNKYKFVFSSINKLRNILSVLYSKTVYIKIINQKSFHLNSDLLSSSISIKLRDRKQKVVRIFKKVVLSAKLPSRFLLLTTSVVKKPKILGAGAFNLKNESYSSIEKKNLALLKQNYILNTVPHKSMSGLRLEGAGRLTRRLTASRSIFKLKYAGSLKNINSSFGLKKSPLLRGYSKSNLQYTLINSKTRNGAHGIKSWISSH